MFVPRLALLLCLVLPLSGFAQDSEPSEVPAPSVTPPPLVPAPPESQNPSEDSPDSTPRGEILPRQWNPERASSPTAPRIILEVFGGALGGSLGLLPGGILVLSALCFDGCDDGAETRGILGIALGLAGIVGGTAVGMIGYEISHASTERSGYRSSASGPRVVPVVSVHPSGGILGGLAGRF